MTVPSAESLPSAREVTIVASDVAPTGGMERVAYEIFGRLLERGWNVTVIARSCALPPQAGLTFHRIWSPSRPVSVALAASFVHGSWLAHRHRTGILQTNNPVAGNHVDVVNVHFCERGYRAAGGPSRSRQANVPYRLNSWLTTRISLALERWCLRPARTRAVTCVSDGVAREVASYYPLEPAQIRTIPNGVDRDVFKPDPDARARVRAELDLAEDARVALFVGGDWHRKGLRAAIEGVARSPGWSLVVVGVGDAETFRALAAKRGAGDRVIFAGRIADPSGHYAAADALLFPSGYEAFSLVTLEAAAAGLALVVPRINGTEELVEEEVNGWFTPADPDAIASRLQALARNPDLLGQVQAAARRSSERYDWEQVTDRYEELYAELAAGAG